MHTASRTTTMAGRRPTPRPIAPEISQPAELHTRHRVRFAGRRLAAAVEPAAGEAGHGDRVARLAEQVAVRLGYRFPSLAFEAGLLHDIGKAALPFDPTVLPRPLTTEERRIVEMHPELGAVVVADAGYPDEVVEGVLLHHERIDGSGYPFGLSGARVPLLAQIVAAVDVYDALATARCYKDPWCRSTILRLGHEQRNRWFLPRVWDALVGATA